MPLLTHIMFPPADEEVVYDRKIPSRLSVIGLVQLVPCEKAEHGKNSHADSIIRLRLIEDIGSTYTIGNPGLLLSQTGIFC
jgi:hypothetical protein